MNILQASDVDDVGDDVYGRDDDDDDNVDILKIKM